MSKPQSIEDLIKHDLQEYEILSSMLSKTVHDINNPLALFVGQLSIMDVLIQRDQLTPEKLEKIINRFKSSSKTLSSRLEYLRNYYKILVDDPNFTQLRNVLDAVVYYYDNLAYKNRINLSHNLEDNSEVELDISSRELFIITKHLIQNSLESLVDSNKEGGGNIIIDCKLNDNSVTISVQDDGAGLIAPLEKAVEIGYSTKEEHSGHGLSIVKYLLDSKNLKLIYEKNEKTSFSVSYPKK